jgi:phenylacetate-CoA ligase
MFQKLAQALYPFLPVWLQNVFISIYGYLWKRRRFGGVFSTELSGFLKREYYSKRQWEDFQTENLRKLLTHAFQTTPYYTELFSERGYTLEQLNCFELDQLTDIPFLQKETLRKECKGKLLSTKLEKGGAFFTSSGSTGTPVQIRFSKRMHQAWSAAFEARIRNWAGVNIKDSRGMIGGRVILSGKNNTPPFYRYNYFESQVYFSINHLSVENTEDYLNAIKKYKLTYMTGYAASNYLLAYNIKIKQLKAPKLKAVITSSEMLTNKMRKTIAEVFDCKVFDSWSGIEACALISECEYGTLHISPDVGIVEIVTSDNKPAKPGQVGEMVCTGFLNYDQPLIRYKIGDLAELASNQDCLCGRHMPIISKIVGRTDDIITLKDGRQLSSFNRVFADVPEINQAQVIQNKDYTLSILYTSDHSTNSALIEANLKKIIASKLGDIDVNLVRVASITKNANGKFKAVISHVKN